MSIISAITELAVGSLPAPKPCSIILPASEVFKTTILVPPSSCANDDDVDTKHGDTVCLKPFGVISETPSNLILNPISAVYLISLSVMFSIPLMLTPG